MQTWARRGLQTALVTGGLLMLGTGIASANEDVNPDRPASPLDGSVELPVRVHDNVAGTPLGTTNLPEVDRNITVSSKELTRALPEPAARQAAPVLDKARALSSPAVGKAREVGGRHRSDDPFRGNRLTGDIVVPVEVCGNAFALGGNAEAYCYSDRSYEHDHPVITSGRHGSLAGNVVNLDWAAPVQVTGNAVGLIGNASACSVSRQSASTGGDIDTDGTDGTLSGNVLSGQLATPVQVAGNAVAGVGNAESVSVTDGRAQAPGSIGTAGDHSTGSGNVGAVPAAVPLTANGNALSGVGNAESNAHNSTSALAGTTRPGGRIPVSSYILTSGEEATLAGNTTQSAISGPVGFNCTAGALVGNAECEGSTDSGTSAGGANQTSGDESVLSGSSANTPVANPVDWFGNAIAVIGNAEAEHDNTVASQAGGDSFTRGDESVLSGSGLTTPVAGPTDFWGNAGSVIGNSESEATQDATASSGGYNGTTGNDAVGSGNAGSLPVAIPVEGFGNFFAAGGSAKGSAREHKVSQAGGTTNTQDDAGTLSSNAVVGSLSGPVQAFGNAAGVIANVDGTGATNSSVTSGGPSMAHGTGGSGSGNIAQVPVSAPAQLFGLGGVAVGNGSATGVGDTTSTSGGDADTDGTDATLSGNVLSAPVGSAAQVFGHAVSAVGTFDSRAGNTTDSTAGGDVNTGGDHGALSGNVVGAHALPVAQAFGNAVSAAGLADAFAVNDTVATSGGDINTSGDHGSLSGNLFDVPVGAVAQVFGNAVAAVGGQSSAMAGNVTYGRAGGVSQTSGDFGQLSGADNELPIGVIGQVHNVPVEILADACTATFNHTELELGDEGKTMALPTGDAGLPATQLPRLPATSELPKPVLPAGFGGAARQGAAHRAAAPRVPNAQLPQVSQLPRVSQLPQPQLSQPQLPGVHRGVSANRLDLGGLAQAKRSQAVADSPHVAYRGVLPQEATGVPALSAMDTTSAFRPASGADGRSHMDTTELLTNVFGRFDGSLPNV